MVFLRKKLILVPVLCVVFLLLSACRFDARDRPPPEFSIGQQVRTVVGGDVAQVVTRQYVTLPVPCWKYFLRFSIHGEPVLVTMYDFELEHIYDNKEYQDKQGRKE